MVRTIFDICEPRADVLQGSTKDEAFAADLHSVIMGTAPPEYASPATFFAHTYPTRGLKDLLKAVCRRLSGVGGEVASIIRLDTQYGGGKTHSLIGLIHAVRGMQSVANASEFVDPALLPKGKLRVAAFDGSNADPANGLRLEEGLFAHSIWGEVAYSLAGRAGYERVRASDETHVAPGAETIRELFGGEPTLIVIDEVSVYLRAVERAFPGASDQFTRFIHALCKAVESSPQVALVYTLAIGKDDRASDAYPEENERAAAAFAEAEHVAARKSTHLNPTEEDETADVLRRRLFAKVDEAGAKETVESYVNLWRSNRDTLPDAIQTDETRKQFLRGYPLHPDLLSLLTRKTSTISTFQRTRGMLRLLARAVHFLWRERPMDAHAIHVHHLALGFQPIRDEVTVRLQQKELVPALKGDVESVAGDARSNAEQIDAKYSPGGLPITVYIARTVYLNTLAFNPDLKGIATDWLKWSITSPSIEPSFIEQARVRFVEESDFLDDRPGAPLRFQAEPNLVQMVRKQMRDIEAEEVRGELDARIRSLFHAGSRAFELVAFPGGPYEVPDDAGSGRPLLVLVQHDNVALAGDPHQVPSYISDLFLYKGANNALREHRNNLVFLVADEHQRENMKTQVRRRLALTALLKPDNVHRLAPYQQEKLKEDHKKSAMAVATSIFHCYRHLFYPSSNPLGDAGLPLGHTTIEFSQASDQPGDGQRHIIRLLREQHKLLDQSDQPNAPGYVRDNTPLKQKGSLSTQELRTEFRRAPKLSILLSDDPLIACIRQGIDQNVFIYREGNQVWGKGDPAPMIRISETAFVHNLLDARAKHLWPRPRPFRIDFKANPREIVQGASSSLVVEIDGGVPPYRVTSSEPGLSLGETENTSIVANASPTESQDYVVTATDSRGEKLEARTSILVRAPGRPGEPSPPPAPPKPAGNPVSPPPPPPPARELTAEGPLASAIKELFEKARRAGIDRIHAMKIHFVDSNPAFKVQQVIATLRDVTSHCAYKFAIEGDGIDELSITFAGRLDKANTIKQFLDAQLRASSNSMFEGDFTLTFTNGQPTDEQSAERLSKDLTRYGAGDAYVEAHAAPQETA